MEAIIWAWIWGLVTGSFAMALAWRLPRGMNWRTGRSRCDACGRRLAFRDLIPILSWLLNRGRCRLCGSSIRRRYVLGELGAGVACAAVVGRGGAGRRFCPSSWSSRCLWQRRPLI
ncbi:prepilin peptidase [Nitrospirillum pindoramense]|uniref:prepilin peptidase n=1 Tax=Nitrospirillum amazonense TaxID=28077 RepID=UPI003B8A8F27